MHVYDCVDYAGVFASRRAGTSRLGENLLTDARHLMLLHSYIWNNEEWHVLSPLHALPVKSFPP
jgi:hypothetical protein